MSNVSSDNSTDDEKEKTSVKAEKPNELIKSIEQILTDVLQDNKNSAIYSERISQQPKMSFTLNKKPCIGLYDYLSRILKYAKIETSTLVLALIYIDNLCEQNNILLTEYNLHK